MADIFEVNGLVARLLDPDNDRVQLDTLVKAASAFGKSLSVELVQG